jgi:predicted nucleic acid-binding protein
MLLLDSDVLIDIQRGHPAAVAWFAGLTDLPTVPGLVVMELIQDSRNKQEMTDSLALVAPLPVVWPIDADCQRALTEMTAFHLSNGIGLLDCLIAATALGRSADLCTFNAKHYRVVAGLKLLQPYTR